MSAGKRAGGAPAALPAAGTWFEIEPGGDTVCSDGTPYRFLVRRGRPDRILIDFQGGGACWNSVTCGFDDSLYDHQATTLAEFLPPIEAGERGGIFDPDPSRPFADWTLIHIPYCTGDLHWGNASQDYGDGLRIEHRGFVNASAVLDWVYGQYTEPSNLFVSGCSAGAYGAILHSAYIAQHYSSARLALLADSGAGIIVDNFLTDSLPNWNAQQAFPSSIPGLDRPLAELQLPDVYEAISGAFPQHRFAQIATQYDADQIFFYSAIGGVASEWPARFRASMQDLQASLPNFRSYIAPGSMHCSRGWPFFYTREVDGVNLGQWTEQLVRGDGPPDSVACEGAACCSDPVCDACKGESDMACRFCENWPPTWSECAPR